VKKIIELIHSVFKSLLQTSSDSLLGVAPLHYSLDLQRELFIDTKIADFFITCFSNGHPGITQDALSNFIEIMPELPMEIIQGHGIVILRILCEKLKSLVEAGSLRFEK